MISKLIPQSWNDTLSLLLLIGIPLLWLKAQSLPEAAVGASIVVWTLIAQFYFRKAKTE